MKKIVTAIITVLCATCMALGFASCLGGGNSSGVGVTYQVDTSAFNSVVKYNGSVDYSALAIVSSEGDSVSVTEEMVSGLNTASVGEKELTITYEQQTLKVEYTVKYEVSFYNGTTQIGEPQYVLTASEIAIPSGYVATDWQPNVPQSQITDNMSFFLNTSITPDGNTTVSLGKEGAYELFVGNTGAIAVTAASSVAGEVTWASEASNDNVTLTDMAGIIRVQAHKAGVTTVKVRAVNANGGFAEATKTVVVKPRSKITIKEAGNTYGIENVLTLGRTDVNGTVSQHTLTVSCGAASEIGEGLLENITWASDNALATINHDGVITLGESTGVAQVAFTAKFTVEGKDYDVSAPFSVRCVWNGVNVNNYTDLYTATKAQKPIVLRGNIDFPKKASEIKFDTMHTTYDDTYYVNVGEQAKAQIKTLLQFKNDLYGNGYVINAHNATAGLLDATGALTNDSIFRGPLNFVAMSESASSTVSVKAQDNVCFAVYEGVTVNNVELRGCDLQADENGKYDLCDLSYVGTTVEVFGDNVNIEYSRITNGRTVLRVFGAVDDSAKVIHLNIKNSVLSGAREFILRIGSNAFVNGTMENPSPYLDANTSVKFPMQTAYSAMQAAQKTDYEEKYIKTFVNVKNSVMKDAGIFCVAMDAHFAGGALADGTGFASGLLTGWRDLAKTSYGAKLTFEGDVRMYDWKRVDSVDSSTLIEILGESSYKDSLDFNVKELIQTIAKNDRLKTVVYEENGVQYVHGGIAFFGGGKNYSVFEAKDYSFYPLNGYGISLENVDKAYLQAAAGTESFYFLLHDSTTRTFLPKHQEEMLLSGDAYQCIYKK